MSKRRLVVAIPVKDESQRLPACLSALAAQGFGQDLTLLVLVNNSTDNSAAIARDFAATASCRVIVEDVVLPEGTANAGGARRLAMHMGSELAGPGGILLTTDADGRPALNWLHTNLRAIAKGAHAVAGRAIIDPIEEALIPTTLLEADAREGKFAELLDEVVAAIGRPCANHQDNRRPIRGRPTRS
jgi:glycosyltransferase involved in cell wall biosynthesis